MLNSFRKLSTRNLGGTVQNCVFFIPFVLFVYFWVDTKLIYHGHGHFLMVKIYVPGMRIFADLPLYPGKVVEYLAANLSHYYYYSCAGALIITTVAWLLCLGADKFITTVGGGNRWRLLRFVPPVLWLVLYCRYHHYLTDSLALLFALLFMYLYIRIPLHRAAPRFIVFLISSAVVYAAAIEAFLVFVLLCAIFEFFKKQQRQTGVLCLLSASLIPYIAGTFVFDLDFIEAYRRTLPFHPTAERDGVVLVIAIFLFFPVVGLGCGFWRFFTQKRQSSQRKTKCAKSYSEHHRKSKLGWTLETLALFIVTTGIVFFASDTTTHQRRRIDYFARHKMWTELLDEVDRLPMRYYDMFVSHDVNRALYHTGRLLDEMFAYPQHHSSLILTSKIPLEGEILIIRWIKSSNTLYELGHINEAENFTTEALEMLNYYPVGLQRLALINIIKGRTDVARVYLNALSKDFLYRHWAKDYLRRLQSDPLLSKDEQIQRLRSFMLVKDGVGISTPKDLFTRNRNNRMAYEYLMAFCLLTKQYAPVARSVAFLDKLGYPKGKIPRHLEEALLLYAAMTNRGVNLHGRRINANTSRRFQNFLQYHQTYKDNPLILSEVLEKEFNDTYYRYYLLNKTSSTE